MLYIVQLLFLFSVTFALTDCAYTNYQKGYYWGIYQEHADDIGEITLNGTYTYIGQTRLIQELFNTTIPKAIGTANGVPENMKVLCSLEKNCFKWVSSNVSNEVVDKLVIVGTDNRYGPVYVAKAKNKKKREEPEELGFSISDGNGSFIMLAIDENGETTICTPDFEILIDDCQQVVTEQVKIE